MRREDGERVRLSDHWREGAGALEEPLEDVGGPKSPFYNERLRFRTQDREGFMRGLERKGPKAISDFTR